MKYKTLVGFFDLQDGNFEYKAGDVYPRSGLKVSEDRCNELATKRNKLGKPLIKAVEQKKTDKKK
jgi:hypothetical protein